MLDRSELVDLVPVHGGSISRAFRARTAGGRVVFLKTRADPPAGMFAAEAASLRWLRAADALPVPEPLGWGEDHLILEWVDPGPPTAATAAELGAGLARMHRAGAPSFGLDEPANLATIPLDNSPTTTWAEFYWSRRLEPLLRRALDAGAIDPAATSVFAGIESGLAERCGPPEAPARLHGDLWAGNVHVARDGRPWLVDPSSYGGHREVDLAMLDLFGGLDPAMVAAYEDVHPLAPGWRDRLPLHQLLPLLVHAVLFGGGYGERTVSTARRVLGHG